MPRVRPLRAALILALALLALPAPAAAHRRIFVWFSDGGLMPASGRSICTGTGRPPSFQCSFGGSVDDCRRQVMMWLDRWYADFDASFTFAPPPDSAGKYDTVIVSSSGTWCGADATIESRSPLPPCQDLGGAALALFKCTDPRTCATLIAKEHGHLMGLQHTTSSTDVMYDQGAVDHMGFEDQDNRPSNVKCGTVQNSYRLMLARLGAWPGGAKPAPDPPLPPQFPDAGAGPADAGPPPPDAEPPPQDAASPADAALVPPDGATDPGGGGCGCRVAARTPVGALPGAVIVVVILGLFTGPGRSPGRRRPDR